MSGYTPVFNGIFDGTLCGRWPETAVWLVLLALADRAGEVDMTPQRIAAVTGMPMPDLLEGLHRLEQPDPTSRSKAEEGRRIVRLATDREWGWRIVNHSVYREKARLMAKAQAEVASGANRERLAQAHRPPLTAGDRRPPPPTASPYSDSYPDRRREEGSARKLAPDVRGSRVPDEHPEDILTPRVREWAQIHTPGVDLTAALEEFVGYWRTVPGARGRKLNWPQVFINRLREVGTRSTRPARGPILLPET